MYNFLCVYVYGIICIKYYTYTLLYIHTYIIHIRIFYEEVQWITN